MLPADLRLLAADAMQSHGLLPAFAPQALQEAEAAARAGAERRGDIRDLRRLPWFSIDNDDTRDLDQLSMAEPLGGDVTRLLVAVADVDSMVHASGAMEAHAAANTTSVYTAAGVFPMLPERLSTNLTSLHQGQERLAMVVDMQVQPDGTVSRAELYRAAVVNQAKLTYDTVAAWLEGSGPPPAMARVRGMPEQVRLHDAVAVRLRQWRSQRGALDLRTASARPVFRDGLLIDLRPEARNRAQDLIADLMIATNTTTARFLAQQGFPSLRRVLDAPRRWDRILALASARGARLPETPDALALDRFLRQSQLADPQGNADLSLAVIKSLGAGGYAAAPPGAPGTRHFGLGVDDYTHSTAPNRRYADLVTQRLVKAALRHHAAPYSTEALAAIAARCAAQESNANKVERQVLKAAAAVLLLPRIGEAFDAIVTGAAPKGSYVRIARPLIEGRLVRGFEGVDVGDRLRVRLGGVRPELGHIDFVRD